MAKCSNCNKDLTTGLVVCKQCWERAAGTWLSCGGGGIRGSRCGRSPVLLTKTPYCSNCGAKMEKGE